MGKRLPECPECGVRHSTDMTCREVEGRFDGYPVDCIIEELLAAEARIKELEEAQGGE